MNRRLTTALAVVALVVLAIPGAAVAQVVIGGPVNDQADVLSPAEEERLASFLVEHRRATQVQLAIVIVDDTGGVPIEDFAIEIAERWRGGDEPSDGGVLLVLSIADGRARIEVGEGLEPELTDGEVRLILEEARPLLEEELWTEALLELVWALSDETTDFAWRGLHYETAGDEGHHVGWWVVIGLAALTVALLGVWGWLRKWRWR